MRSARTSQTVTLALVAALLLAHATARGATQCAYPATLDNFTDVTVGQELTSTLYNKLQCAAEKIEAELGALPKGGYATVKARLDDAVYTSRQVLATGPLTGGGDLSADRMISFLNQNANLVLAGPASGGAAAPSFRSLVADDIPNIDVAKVTSGVFAYARGGTGAASYTTNRIVKAGAAALANSLLSDDGTDVSITSGQLLLQKGSASAPGLSFVGDEGIGFTGGTNEIFFSNATTNFFAFGAEGGYEGLKLASSGAVNWTSGAVGAAIDTKLSRVAASVIGQRLVGTNQSYRWYSANDGYLQQQTQEELHTLALAATSSTTMQFAAGSLGTAASARITTTITGCASVQFGVGGDATRYGTFSTLTAGQTIATARADNYAASTPILFTCVGGGGSFSAGALRVVIFQQTASAPLS